MTNTIEKTPTEKLLVAFSQYFLRVAQHQSDNRRPISNLNPESIAHQFVQQNPDLIAQAQVPDLSNLFLVSGRVHGDDEDTVHIVEGNNPSGRFIYELLGFNPDNSDEVPEDAETRVYVDESPLLTAIESRLTPIDDDS